MTSHPHFPASEAARRQSGFSLVELMVALAIGLALVIVISYAYLGSKQTFRVQDALSRMQENARFVFETMTFDIRMAGFTGCPTTTTPINVLNNSTDWDKDLLNFPLVGYEAGAIPITLTGVYGNVLRGDALTVLRGSEVESIVASGGHQSASGTALFTLHAGTTHDIPRGEMAIVTDCTQQAIFQMTNSSTATIEHRTGIGTPGNATAALGTPLGTTYTFPGGSRIMRMLSVNYHIRNNANNEPALVRLRRAADSSGNAIRVVEELVEGVQDMQITYGVDTSPTADNIVDDYLQADQIVVGGAVPGTTAIEVWRRVVSVRISLLLASTGSDAYTKEAQTYTFNGSTTKPTDRRLRKVFNTTIAVRNRPPLL